MEKKEAGYYLPHQCIFIYRNNNQFLMYELNEKELIEINDLEAAKRVVFEFKENNEWANIEFLKRHTDDLILIEVLNIVGKKTMKEAIEWAENIQEQYLSSKRNYINKILIDSSNHKNALYKSLK
jgi:hypothetical protein